MEGTSVNILALTRVSLGKILTLWEAAWRVYKKNNNNEQRKKILKKKRVYEHFVLSLQLFCTFKIFQDKK